jgi:hypothetical protein
MRWEAPHIFAVFFQIMTPYAKTYKNKLFTLQHTRFDKKKNFVFQLIFLLKYDTLEFLKRNVHVISNLLNNHNVYINSNVRNGTKVKRLSFTCRTHFEEMGNTPKICHFLPNYDSECKKLTRTNFSICNTHYLGRKENIVFGQIFFL